MDSAARRVSPVPACCPPGRSTPLALWIWVPLGARPVWPQPGQCRFCCIGFSVVRFVARVGAEPGECSLGGNKRHAAALLVVPPDGIVVFGAHLFDQILLEKAFEEV